MVRPARIFIALFFLLTSTLAFSNPVDINTADAETLAAAISGVGQAKAEAIVAYRQEHGPFASVDDLVKVKGIGEKTVAKNKVNLTVSSKKE